MRLRNLALVFAVVLGFALAFFFPFIPVSGFPFFCWSNGHFGCMGGVVHGPPTIGSISYWLFGYGGTFAQGIYQVTWP